MKILVTGSSGFIGSHLTEYLVERGYGVVAFDRYNNNHYGWLEKSKYKKKIEFSLEQYSKIDKYCKKLKIAFESNKIKDFKSDQYNNYKLLFSSKEMQERVFISGI